MAEQIRVLIVDDIPETRDHLSKLLGFEGGHRRGGCSRVRHRGPEARVSVNPDVVLMDINMPDMDGIATTEELARAVPTASVIMMSVQGEATTSAARCWPGPEFLVSHSAATS